MDKIDLSGVVSTLRSDLDDIDTTNQYRGALALLAALNAARDQALAITGQFTTHDARRAIALEDIGFHPRVYNSLKRASLRTLGDVADRTEAELFGILRNAVDGVDAVVSKLATYGLEPRTV